MQRVKPVVPKPLQIIIILLLRMMMMVEHSCFTKSMNINEPNQTKFWNFMTVQLILYLNMNQILDHQQTILDIQT